MTQLKVDFFNQISRNRRLRMSVHVRFLRLNFVELVIDVAKLYNKLFFLNYFH